MLRALRLRCSMSSMWLRDTTALINGQGRLGAWLFSVLAVPALLAQPSAELEVQTLRPYVNETIWVKVRVHDAQDVAVPDFPPLPHCQTRYVGPESQTRISITGGRRQMLVERTHQYALTPQYGTYQLA